MSQRNLNFGPLPTGAVLITPSGELVIKDSPITATSADPEFGTVIYEAGDEVQVDVETTMSGLLRAILMNAESAQVDGHVTVGTEPIAAAEQFMTLIGEL